MEEKNKYTFVIIEDEALARQLLLDHLTKIPNLTCLQTFASASEAENYFLHTIPDILFLDIHLPKISGIEFLKKVPISSKVILTTAFSEFAVEGFELNVVDYLLKPITFIRFHKAIEKAFVQLSLKKENPNTANPLDTIIIKSSHQIIPIHLDDILFIESMHKYVKIVTSKKTYTTLLGIATIEKQLPELKFFKCHRSFIIQISRIEKIESNIIYMQDYKIPISKSNKSNIIKALNHST